MHALDDQTWRDVVAAMDSTYSELVDYQERLGAQNRELDEMRRIRGCAVIIITWPKSCDGTVMETRRLATAQV